MTPPRMADHHLPSAIWSISLVFEARAVTVSTGGSIRGIVAYLQQNKPHSQPAKTNTHTQQTAQQPQKRPITTKAGATARTHTKWGGSRKLIVNELWISAGSSNRNYISKLFEKMFPIFEFLEVWIWICIVPRKMQKVRTFLREKTASRFLHFGGSALSAHL